MEGEETAAPAAAAAAAAAAALSSRNVKLGRALRLLPRGAAAP